MTSAFETAALREILGTDSPAFRQATERLSALYSQWETIPPVANSFLAWANCRPEGASDPPAFISHTCVSLLCRLMAYRFLEPVPSERDLWSVAGGDYFVGAQLGNFLGEDFFSWPFFRKSIGIGEDREALEIARDLMLALQPFDFTGAKYDAPLALGQPHEEFPEPPGDSLLADNPRLTCLDADCGCGLLLAREVDAVVSGRLAQGESPIETVMDVSWQFLGMTRDPLYATLSATAFLFAMGEAVREPHPPILVPVYLADASRLPVERPESGGERSYVITAANGIALPERVATDPVYLDWLLGRLPNYLRGAALRLRGQPEEEALQEVLTAWYNYLTSPKARTPIPDPLSPAAADVMVEAARTLITAYIRGSGPAPLHLARNAPAPLFAARREFDVTL